MSRVDEAIRRAAERASGPSAEPEPATDGPVEAGGAAADVSALSRESYPLEMPARRTRTAQPAPFPVAAEVARAVPAATAGPKRGSLIDRMDLQFAEKVVIDQRIMPASREQYRRLAASLHHAQNDRNIKVVMIASALPGEGKTLTASNLALTFSESYHRSVLLIDADLRKPALHTLFGVDNSEGLSEGLVAVEERKLPVRRVSARLAILPAGGASSDPMAGLTSERMHRLINEARELFDWVIIDTPPVAFLSDANLLAAMVDTAVLVVKAGSTSYDHVQRAVEAIGRERTCGVVLNRVEGGYHGSSYANYDPYYQKPRGEAANSA